MLQLLLISAEIFASKRPFWFAADYVDHCVARGFKAAGAGGHVNRGHASREDGADHGAGHDVLLRRQEGVDYAMNRRAAGHASGDLRNHQPRKLQLRVPATVLRDPLRHLLRRGHAEIDDDAAMQRLRIVEVDNVFREVGAVPRYQMEMRLVRLCVQFADQGFVLLRRGLNFKTVAGAIVRRTHEFVPVSGGSFAVVRVGSDAFEILPAVAVAQKRNHFRVREQRHILGALDAVEIRDEGNGDPVMSANAVVAADDDARFTRYALAKDERGLRAYAGKIDRGMAGRSEESQRAVGFFNQQS